MPSRGFSASCGGSMPPWRGRTSALAQCLGSSPMPRSRHPRALRQRVPGPARAKRRQRVGRTGLLARRRPARLPQPCRPLLRHRAAEAVPPVAARPAQGAASEPGSKHSTIRRHCRHGRVMQRSAMETSLGTQPRGLPEQLNLGWLLGLPIRKSLSICWCRPLVPPQGMFCRWRPSSPHTLSYTCMSILRSINEY